MARNDVIRTDNKLLHILHEKDVLRAGFNMLLKISLLYCKDLL